MSAPPPPPPPMFAANAAKMSLAAASDSNSTHHAALHATSCGNLTMVGTPQPLAVSPTLSPTTSSILCASLDPNKELFSACKNGDIIKVRKLINASNVNLRDISGRKSELPSILESPAIQPTTISGTPLHFASGFGRRDVVELLLSLNADVHAKDDGGLVPLHNACTLTSSDVITQNHAVNCVCFFRLVWPC